MQFGQRTQNATANKTANKTANRTANTSQRHRRTSVLPPGTGHDPQDQAPPSAARLAAEAAFAGPTFSLIQNGQTQITVRRARSFARAERPAEVSPAAAEQPVAKGPRVFRIDSARVHATVSAEAALQPPPVQITDTQPLTPKNRRRRAQEQRSGPVVLVQVPAKPPTATAASPALRSKILVAGLARVTPILAAIEEAQAFQFIDNRFESHYQRLSRQADLLLNQLKSHRR